MALDLSDIQEFVEDELMIDQCTITRDPDFEDEGTWDPVTMTYSGEGADDAIYSGKCWVSMGAGQTLESDQGGSNTQEMWYFLNIPLGSPPVVDKDFVTITSIGETSNPDLDGATFFVQNDEVGTYKVKKRIRMRRVIHTRTS